MQSIQCCYHVACEQRQVAGVKAGIKGWKTSYVMLRSLDFILSLVVHHEIFTGLILSFKPESILEQNHDHFYAL